MNIINERIRHTSQIRSRRKNKTGVPYFDKCVIPRMIIEFHTEEGNRTTLKSPLAVIKKRSNLMAVRGFFEK
jgi:hypothetical protein